MLLPRPRDKQRHCLAQPTAAQGRPSHGGIPVCFLGDRDAEGCDSLMLALCLIPADKGHWPPSSLENQPGYCGAELRMQDSQVQARHYLVPTLKTLVRSKPKKKNQQQKKDKI